LDWEAALEIVNSRSRYHKFVDKSIHRVMPLAPVVADPFIVFLSQQQIPLGPELREAFNRSTLWRKFLIMRILIEFAAKLWMTQLNITPGQYEKQAQELSDALTTEMINKGIAIPRKPIVKPPPPPNPVELPEQVRIAASVYTLTHLGDALAPRWEGECFDKEGVRTWRVRVFRQRTRQLRGELHISQDGEKVEWYPVESVPNR